ncbi:DNA-methyltransferase [Aeromonas hydrophila]|uniref:DNA-methyltransferase n=1 Tax=Aeromonas hydrophila TaxID=644 RepID=UPI0009BBCA49|nr:site-specific DNA-methyltransferase [Aeromonas hydrophila]HDK8695939.1 site-specific DNA-methyltransferase [Aeromonas hydrophila]
MTVQLYLGECLSIMRSLQDNSVDSIVTDPPYGLRFMGKKWDYDVPSVEVWAECLRILKPGGHLLAFAGTRTHHRMTVNIEDAGFEIRDMVSFLYDTNETAQALIESLSPEQLKLLDASFGRDGMLGWVYGSGMPKSHNLKGDWEGWGTTLKPALEPITLARKPFKGTVAANVQAHGPGALNIAGCRVGGDGGRWPANLCHDGSAEVVSVFPAQAGAAAPVHARNGDKFRNTFGTFKGNIDERGSSFHGDSGSASRFFYCAKASRKDRHEGMDDPGPQFKHGVTLRQVENAVTKGNNHPTVKPTELMRWLCRLITPPGGWVFDPFMGSGSTGVAAIREGFQFIGVEMDDAYYKISEKRICAAMTPIQDPHNTDTEQLTLFSEGAA